MKIYGITILPTSPFGTPLKGDTIFGQFCWQAADDPALLTGGLDKWIAGYVDGPFAVFSSAWPVLQQADQTVYALARPAGLTPDGDEPQDRRQRIERNKADKKRKWLLVDKSMKVRITDDTLKTDEDLFTLFMESRTPAEAKSLRLLSKEQKKLCTPVTQSHNSINRLTMTTGSGQFAPFAHDNFQYLPGLSLVIFAAVDEQALEAQQLHTAFERIGSWGFGRDASAGLGRFTVTSVTEHAWPQAAASDTACFTLGPLVPPKQTFARCYAEPFTRFGRHGAALACSGNPFKKPVIMADEGAVLYPVDRDVFASPCIGTAVTDVSAADKRTVVQGYSLYLPC
jgi:CRISPR-associated protein Csm4